MGYWTRQELWNDLTLTGNWGNRRLDDTGDGVFTGADDRDELSGYSTFNTANEWTTRREDKGSATTEYKGRADTYDAVGDMTKQISSRVMPGFPTVSQERGYKYDMFGRAVQIGQSSSGVFSAGLSTVYRYNGLNQRIMAS